MKRYHKTGALLILLVGSVLMASCDIKHTSSEGWKIMPRPLVAPPGVFLEEWEGKSLPRGTELRKVYDKGIELTKRSEGFIYKVYDDLGGYCVVGYGHVVKRNRCDGMEPEEFRRGITEDRGTEILRADMAMAERAVMTLVDNAQDLTDGQYAALCDFVFNVGRRNFERSTLRQVLNRGEYDRVPNQLRRWVNVGLRTWPGLATRREREIGLFFEGMEIPQSIADSRTLIDIRVGEQTDQKTPE
uniref:Lysozyme n=1 Tax=Candidatus Kentrum sp. FM TaxID=2126340 RepID=A0A450X4Q4_9GAMM|nr:MAG: Phage-related lysozyme (muramidase), GH24 family [Candidatus Kentron sp. FM]VFJ76505.1 MAG: Phage-related lysozyme (muramidase), GH24 family [Candidatus Kentron sp. FM]VFK24302.1 MAG: Phage-related lysozyme (muramidase), GH24 family [Candidatus Kentron sp. FM]